MVIGSQLNKPRRDRAIADIEGQGAQVRITKRGGLLITAADGAKHAITSYSDDRTGLNADILWFRNHGLTHPADRRQIKNTKEDAEVVERNDEGYPLYLTSPINRTTRERVLAELESKGWPLEVLATDLSMDSTSASKALYAVGYRWGDDGMTGKKNRVWHAPDEIVRLHQLARKEAERRMAEEREARLAAAKERAAEEAMAGHEGVEGHPMQVVKTDSVLAAVQDARTKPLPSLDFVKHVGHEGEHHPVLNPEVHPEPKTIGHVVFQEKQEDYALASFVDEKPEPHEREFVDDVDSWTADESALPEEVKTYLNGLRAAGLAVEIRVWRNK